MMTDDTKLLLLSYVASVMHDGNFGSVHVSELIPACSGVKGWTQFPEFTGESASLLAELGDDAGITYDGHSGWFRKA